MSLKQVIVVRKDLNMRKGKMIAQAGHAVESSWIKGATIEGDNLIIPLSSSQKSWIEDSRHTKICVSVNSESELLEVYNKAVEAKVPAVIIEDFGLTEFKGQKTLTVVSLGPFDSEAIDAITGHLPLL